MGMWHAKAPLVGACVRVCKHLHTRVLQASASSDVHSCLCTYLYTWMYPYLNACLHKFLSTMLIHTHVNTHVNPHAGAHELVYCVNAGPQPQPATSILTSPAGQ